MLAVQLTSSSLCGGSLTPPDSYSFTLANAFAVHYAWSNRKAPLILILIEFRQKHLEIKYARTSEFAALACPVFASAQLFDI